MDEFVRTYSRPNGWEGAIGLYRSMPRKGAEIRALAGSKPLTMPVLAIGAGSGSFTAATMKNAGAKDIRSETLEGVGHYVAMEAEVEVVGRMSQFLSDIAQN